MDYQQRVANLRHKLTDAATEALLSFNPPDNQYLTGFTGTTSAVIVTGTSAFFLCDPRYTEQAETEVRSCEIREVRGNLVKQSAEFLQRLGARSAAIDPAVVTLAQSATIREGYEGELRHMVEAVAGLRLTKDADEIALIRRASDVAEGALEHVTGQMAAGITELEVAAMLEYEFKQRGASGPSFDTIVLFGTRSSLPHGRPGDTRLQRGDIVLIDLGCRRSGYCSDLTRTFVFDRIPGAWFEEIYAVTLAAQQTAIDAVRPGISARDVDAVARKSIADAGFGNRFGHGLGHGVGIEIHESPRLNSETGLPLREGMVVTIEPGVYLPGLGGVRIEDVVAVTGNGCQVLDVISKELKVLK